MGCLRARRASSAGGAEAAESAHSLMACVGHRRSRAPGSTRSLDRVSSHSVPMVLLVARGSWALAQAWCSKGLRRLTVDATAEVDRVTYGGWTRVNGFQTRWHVPWRETCGMLCAVFPPRPLLSVPPAPRPFPLSSPPRPSLSKASSVQAKNVRQIAAAGEMSACITDAGEL